MFKFAILLNSLSILHQFNITRFNTLSFFKKGSDLAHQTHANFLYHAH